MCVCWSGFEFHLVFFFVYVWICVLRFLYMYVYIYIYICFHLCVCGIHDLFNLCLNLSIKFLSFIWSNVSLFVWYIGIISNLLRLHWYRCFDTFDFPFFFYFDITPMKWCPYIKDLRWPYIYSFAFCTFNYIDYIFEWQLKSLFWICFRGFKGIGFSFDNFITYFAWFIVAFGNPCVGFSPNVDDVSILLKIFGLSLAFNDFCCA